MSTRVVNRKAPGATYDVYVGRPSIWGNPFSYLPSTAAKFKVKDRAEAIRKYEEWIRAQPNLIERAKRELKGKTLGCWCKPLACHADVLARIADEDDRPAEVVAQIPYDAREAGPRGLPSPQVLALVPGTRGSYDPRAEGAKCDECPLFGRHAPVPSKFAIAGKDATKLVILGEGPGRMEIARGEPFVGPSGQLLDAMLDKAGFSRKDASIVNAASCRGETDYEKDRAAACCAPRLAKELASLPPNAPILALGAPAMKTMLGRGSILKTRGFVWKIPIVEDAKIKGAEKALTRKIELRKPREFIERAQGGLWRLQARHEIGGRICIPSIHPAMILRGADAWKPVLAQDVKRACRWAKKPFKLITDVEKWATATTPGQLHRELRAIKDVKEIVLDVETDGPDPLRAELLMLGISEVPLTPDRTDDLRVVLASPWDPNMAPIVREFVKTRTVVGHNLKVFDQIVMERRKVPMPKVEDSLVAHHAYASHLRQGLDHVVSVYTDAGPWKIEFKSSGAEEKGVATYSLIRKGELDKYNAADVVTNAVAWVRMKPDLAPERHVYEHDMELAEMCRQMIVNGFRIDLERREYLHKRLKERRRYLLGEMRKIVEDRSFHPAKTADLRRALYGKFALVPLKATPTGLPATDSGVLEALRGLQTPAGKLADLTLRWRWAAKIDSTYVGGCDVHDDGRTHPTWKPCSTPTGRLACRTQTLPRPEWTKAAKRMFKAGAKPKEAVDKLGYDGAYELEARVRELYISEPDWELHYFDLGQSEMRMAAYNSNDPNFIASCESGDVHSANACILFPDAAELILKDPKGQGKEFRDITKNAGFGIIYLAEVPTIYGYLHSKGFTKVTPNQVEAMFVEIKKRYRRYYEFCEEQLAFCKRHGYLRTRFLGRIRWLGWFPKPTDVANSGVQPNIADLMNSRVLGWDWEAHCVKPELGILPRLPKLRNGKPMARVVAQIHDALIIEAHKSVRDEVRGIIKETWDRPIVMPHTGRSWIMPIDQKLGERWSDLG